MPGRPAPDGDPSLHDLLLHISRRRARAQQRLVGAGDPARVVRSDAAGTRAVATSEARAAAPGGEAGTVLALDRPTPDLLRMRLARPAGFTYRAGQSVRLQLDGVRRRYTLVSAPHEPDLEFFIELVPGGPMSERWRALRPGDRVTVAGAAKGGIDLVAGTGRHLMIATVTGVNPFVSLLRDAVHRGRRDLACVLVHGASFADEFGYHDELTALAAARPDLLTYVPTVSRPGEPRNAGWTGAQGRADAHVDAVRARHGLTAATTAGYACGHPAMVDTVQTHLRGLGFTVRVERYA
jgi:NAD(P)H-flavin reductase